MNYKFYTKTEKAWDAMLSAVRGAKSSIYFESYIFLSDTEDRHNFTQALREKAQAGVDVRVVFDRWGSWYLPESEEESLRSAGVDLVYYSDFLRRIHRKVLVVDRTIAFVGGVNIGKQYQKWSDLHLRLAEQPLVEGLLRSFWRSYRGAGGKHRETEREEVNPNLRERAELWLLDHWPKRGASTLRKYYEEQISNASQSVTIVSPYFFPHRWLVESLRNAKERGVEVSVILPKHTDPAILNAANLVFAAALSREGLAFYFSPVMNHAKALLVDESTGLVGSQNIDALSFDFNAEVGVSFTEPNMIRDFSRIITTWKRDAVRFSHETYRRNWYHKLVELAVRALQPVL